MISLLLRVLGALVLALFGTMAVIVALMYAGVWWMEREEGSET